MNDELSLPPKGKLQNFVEESWEAAFKKLDGGFDLHSDILLIEYRLRNERQLLDNNSVMPPAPDEEDLFLAEVLHEQFKGDFLPARRRLRENEILAFVESSKIFSDLWSGISSFGIRTLLIAHGTIAISALAAYSQINDNFVRIILGVLVLVSVVGAIFAAFGIIVVGRFYGAMKTKHDQVAIYQPSTDRIKEIRVEISQLSKKYLIGDWFLYFSLAIIVLSGISVGIGLSWHAILQYCAS